jgi:hypothetical protein
MKCFIAIACLLYSFNALGQEKSYLNPKITRCDILARVLSIDSITTWLHLYELSDTVDIYVDSISFLECKTLKTPRNFFFVRKYIPYKGPRRLYGEITYHREGKYYEVYFSSHRWKGVMLNARIRDGKIYFYNVEFGDI